MSSHTSRRIHLHMPSTKPKRRRGSASPMRKKSGSRERNSKKHNRHFGGAIIVDNGAKLKQQRVSIKDKQRRNEIENEQIELQRKEWEAYKCELNNLTSWLAAAAQVSARWMAPSNNILSIRVILERHLASAMELETHQHQKDTVLAKGCDLVRQYPQLASELEATLLAIDAQFQQLGQRLEQQFIEIEEALEGAKANISKGRNEGEQCINLEQAKDTLDQMALRLRSRKRRNSPMETNIQALNRQVGGFNTTSRLQSSRQEPQQQQTQQSTLTSTLSSTLSTTLGSTGSYSSSPDFDALYEELSDWLKDMQVAVSECTDGGVSDMRVEHMGKGYEQELQMREVSRTKLERKAQKLIVTNPNQANEIAYKLESINQHWQSLQERLNPQKAPSTKSNKKKSATKQPKNAFESSEEALSVVVEVEDIIVKLKAWLIGMERRLFAVESVTCPGNVEEMEKRLAEHKELQRDINKHAEGIKVVLTMCNILQNDKYACASDKEQEALQLAAINLERRWEAIQAQARDLQCGLEMKLRTFKGPEAISSTPDAESSKPESESPKGEDKDHVLLSPSSPMKSQLAAVHQLFRPSAAKDDDAVDGYTNRMQDLSGGVDYDDFLIPREAFSENDAFSMSETSDVSIGDFDYDDVYLMKKGDEDEEILLGACASPPSDCGTPEILAMSDDMLDAYLRMEEEILLQEELEDEPQGTPIHRKRNQSSASDVEFWSVSPREDNMMSSMEFSTGEFDDEPMILRAGEQSYQSGRESRRESNGFITTYAPLSSRFITTYAPLSSSLPAGDRGSLPEIVCAASSAPASFQPWMRGSFKPGPIDLWSASTGGPDHGFGLSDEDESYGGDAEDNDDPWDEHDMTVTEEPQTPVIQEIFAFEDDFKMPTKNNCYSDDLAPSKKDLYGGSTNLKTHTMKYLSSSDEDLKKPVKGSIFDDDMDHIPTKDVSDNNPTKQNPLSTSLKFKPEKRPYLPKLITSSSAPLDWSGVPIPSKPSIVKPFSKSKGFYPSLYDEDDFMAVQEALSDDAELEGMKNQQAESKNQLLQLRRSLNSSLGETIMTKKLFPEIVSSKSKYHKDDLLEITDLSLSHMCESLDFMTELAHWIMPVHQGNEPPVKDTAHSPPTRDTSITRPTRDSSEPRPRRQQPQQEQLSRPTETQNPLRSNRRESGTQSPSLSFDDLFEDYSESAKPNVVEVSSKKQDISDTETESSMTLSSHESDDRPTRDTAVPVRNQRSRTSRVEHALDESDGSPVRIAETSIGSIDLPEFNQPEIEHGEEVYSNPESSTPSHDDIPEQESPELSPIQAMSESQSSTGNVGEEDHQAYFTYVSDLAEATSEGELTRVFGEFQQQKCHVWSMGTSETVGFPAPSPEEQEIIAEVKDLEKQIASAEIFAEELDEDAIDDEVLETLSQHSADTDKLMEASDELVKELQDRRRLQMEPLPESEVGSWRDVIVLWLKENEETEKMDATVQSEETDTVTPTNDISLEDEDQEPAAAAAVGNGEDKAGEPSGDIIDSGVWTCSQSSAQLMGSGAAPGECVIIEDADSGQFSEPSEEGSPVRIPSPKHSPCLEPLQEDIESVTDDTEEEEDVPPQVMEVEAVTVIRTTEDKAVSTRVEERPSLFRRVLRMSLPIQILLVLYFVVVLILPTVVINGRGECNLSMTDRLMFNGRKWVPTVTYTRGPPPM